jgi:hypothetical protein
MVKNYTPLGYISETIFIALMFTVLKVAYDMILAEATFNPLRIFFLIVLIIFPFIVLRNMIFNKFIFKKGYFYYPVYYLFWKKIEVSKIRDIKYKEDVEENERIKLELSGDFGKVSILVFNYKRLQELLPLLKGE